MNWELIKVSEDQTFFTYDGEMIFNRNFIQVMKFHAPGLAPVTDETGSYHIDIHGKPLYPERYSRTFGYYCNRAAVISSDDWFHLDENGKRVYNETYAWAGNYQEDLCPVRDFQNSYFHIDKFGRRAYRENYSYCGDFREGVACVRLFDGLFRHIDFHGNFIHVGLFLDLGVFHKGFATAKDEKGWHHINKQGQPVYSQRYKEVEPFYNGFALVTMVNQDKAIIGEDGNLRFRL